MRVRKTVGGPAPDIAAAAGTAAICVFGGPVGLLAYPLLRVMVARKIGRAMDDQVESNAAQITREFHRSRRRGEKTIEVSFTKGSRGALFDLPVTRTYIVDLDDD